MKKSSFFIALLTLGFASLFLFQNCAEQSALKGQTGNIQTPSTGDNTANANGDNTPVIPEPTPAEPATPALSQRAVALDNPLVVPEILDESWTITLGTDVLHYQTGYRGTTKTTYAQIIFDGMNYVMVVDGDNCSAQGVLTLEETQEAYRVVVSRFNGRLAPPSMANCDYPKVSINAANPAIKDITIHLTRQVECVPMGSHYIDPANPNNVATLIDDINGFYNAKIDEICGP